MTDRIRLDAAARRRLQLQDHQLHRPNLPTVTIHQRPVHALDHVDNVDATIPHDHRVALHTPKRKAVTSRSRGRSPFPTFDVKIPPPM